MRAKLLNVSGIPAIAINEALASPDSFLTELFQQARFCQSGKEAVVDTAALKEGSRAHIASDGKLHAQQY